MPQETTISATGFRPASFSVPLRIEGSAPWGGAEPVTFGVPFPRGQMAEPGPMGLQFNGRTLPVQTEVLARWSDGSVKWLLVDCLLDESANGVTHASLQPWQPADAAPEAGPLVVRDQDEALVVETGAATFEVDRREFRPLRTVRCGNAEPAAAPAMETRLIVDECQIAAHVETLSVETRGPVRTTLLATGSFAALGMRFHARLSFFAGTGLVRVVLSLRNPRRARHRGGLWDLGDPGSVLFGGLDVLLRAAWPAWGALVQTNADAPWTEVASGWSLRQESSGEKNGQGRTAAPIVVLDGEHSAIALAVPEFWQNFPKSLSVAGTGLRVGVFAGETAADHEIQGGEQKTHTLWLSFHGAEGGLDPQSAGCGLGWTRSPARVVASPEWFAQCGVFPHLLPAGSGADPRFRQYMDEAIRGPQSLLARREVIDEYGWRNYGEVYADHENAYYQGPKPVVSHYNNQFDVVYGAILQQARTGDPAWKDLYDPLARHVIDIDIYHTDRDRPAYNGGLFWPTDHYLSAGTATHRTYSRANRPADGRPYGGGPGPEHNYATGLLHYYYLTGNRDALAAVLGLADWVIAMDDGRRTALGPLDPGPTGVASATVSPDYHGPGRGAANSIGALLDGWLASGDRKYLDKAEELVRRTIHPADDVAARDLLEIEARWSYTMHLAAIARYLELKIELGELDFMYAYAQRGLVHYAAWMVEHERPYFDRPEKMQYPTEAWAVQEFRKANVLRLAARHAGEPLRSRCLERGRELADRAWQDLLRFESKNTARAIAVMMIEGGRDSFFRVAAEPPAPKPLECHDFGRPEAFVPQRERVKRSLRTPAGLARAACRLANPLSWLRMARSLWAARN